MISFGSSSGQTWRSLLEWRLLPCACEPPALLRRQPSSRRYGASCGTGPTLPPASRSRDFACSGILAEMAPSCALRQAALSSSCVDFHRDSARQNDEGNMKILSASGRNTAARKDLACDGRGTSTQDTPGENLRPKRTCLP